MKIALFLLGYIIYMLFTANLPRVEVLNLIMVILTIIPYIITKIQEEIFKSLVNRKM